MQVRRYRCRSCGAVIVVVPRGLVRRRLFSGPAIACALALFGLLGKTAAEVRWRVSPWRTVGPTAKAGWVQLLRWTRSIRARGLFECVRTCPEEFSAREVAERAAATIIAYALPSEIEAPVEVRAFRGALRAA